MTSAGLTAIMSIIMSFITMISSIFGIIQSKPDTSVIQGFEVKEENAMRIMSFNIRCANVGKDSWEDRIGIVSQTMLESEADSIGVQEATPEWMATLKETVGEKYAYVGVGRDDGDNEGEYSAVFYLKDKYEVVDSDTFWLSETPDKPSFGWDAACRRVCTWVQLKDKETGKQYVHMNTHFDHIGISARKNSVEMIIDKAKTFTDIPVVFTADMNVVQGDGMTVFRAVYSEMPQSRTVLSGMTPYWTPGDTICIYDGVNNIFSNSLSAPAAAAVPAARCAAPAPDALRPGQPAPGGPLHPHP